MLYMDLVLGGATDRVARGGVTDSIAPTVGQRVPIISFECGDDDYGRDDYARGDHRLLS